MKRGSDKGFTLLDVVIASTVMALIFLSLVDALFFVRRITRGLCCRLAAEEIAYDSVNEIFNYPTAWFESNASTAWGRWYDSTYGDTERYSRRNSAFRDVWVQQKIDVQPSGNPVVYWDISTFIRWQDPFTMQWHDELQGTSRFHVKRYNILRNAWR